MNRLAAPPYGMNEYSSLYMIMAVFANLSYCLRAVYNGVFYGISNWKDLVIDDSKINLRAISNTIIKRINAGEIADQFAAIFTRINSNMDIDMVENLEQELSKLTKAEKVPDQLAAHYQLAKMKLQEGHKLIHIWNNTFDNTMKLYDKLLEKTDIYSGLLCLQELTSYQFHKVFTGTSYAMSETQVKLLKDQANLVRTNVEPYITGYINMQKCNSVDNISGYKSFMKKLRILLEDQGYAKQAALCKEIAEKELSNKELIKERQEIRAKYNSFIKDSVPDEATAYTKLVSWKEQGVKLLESIDHHLGSLGNDGTNMQTTIRNHLDRINTRIEELKAKMNKIYDDLYSLDSLNGVQELIADIDRMKLYGIPDPDMKDFLEIKQVLNTFVDDIAVMMEEQNNRLRFQENFRGLYNKYMESDLEFDILSILEGVATTIRKELNNKDTTWSRKHLETVPDTVEDIHVWMQDTESLPTYLSDETRVRYGEIKEIVKMKLSKAKVDDIIHSFQNLTDDEKTRCFDALKLMM